MFSLFLKWCLFLIRHFLSITVHWCVFQDWSAYCFIWCSTTRSNSRNWQLFQFYSTTPFCLQIQIIFFSLQVLTKDSVTVTVDAVVYFRIYNATMSVTNVSDAQASTRLLAQTTLRNMIGSKTLSEIFSDRESISNTMQVKIFNSPVLLEASPKLINNRICSHWNSWFLTKRLIPGV